MGGELQETSKRAVLRTVELHDELVDQAKLGLLREEDQDSRNIA